MAGLLDFLQSASNSAASNVSGPVDLLAWALKKAGVPVGNQPMLGSAWMEQQGLTKPVPQSAMSLAGETAGLLAPIWIAAKAPQIAAWRNAVNELAESGAGRMPFASQRGAVFLGDEWAGKSAPNIDKLARNKGKFLYHSGVADDAASMKYGIDPSNEGPWIREVASGAVDDVDGLLSSSTPLAWLSDTPTWVHIKVARKLGKPLSEVTTDDIAKHGHLAVINKKSPSLAETYYIPSEGLGNGPYSTVIDMRGQKKKAYETSLYGESNYGSRIEPFGVERNEYVSTKTVDPLLQLTGPKLVQFLRSAGIIGGAK